MSYGQDRFRRRYWVLPTAGGVYVESMESSEPPGGDSFYFSNPSNVKDEECADEVKENKEVKADEDNSEKIKTDIDDAEKIKSEKEDSAVESSDVEESKKIVENDDTSEGELVIDEKPPNDVVEESKVESVNVESHSGAVKSELKEKAAEKKSDKNNHVKEKLKHLKKESIEVKPFVDSTRISPHTIHPNDKSSLPFGPFIDPNCFMNNSVTKDLNSAALLGMFGKFDPSLQNNSMNPFTANFMSSALALNTEQMIKNTIDATSTPAIPNDAKPWFSLLPRAPCDDTSLTINPSKSKKIFTNPVSSPATTSQSQFCTSPATSSNNGFPAFQPNFSPMPVMNLMNGSNFLPPGMFNPGQFGHPFGSVYPPIMFPSLGYGMDPAVAAPSNTFYSPIPTVPPITIPSIASLATTVSDSEKMSEPLPENLQAIVLDRLNQHSKPKAIPSGMFAKHCLIIFLLAEHLTQFFLIWDKWHL